MRRVVFWVSLLVVVLLFGGVMVFIGRDSLLGLIKKPANLDASGKNLVVHRSSNSVVFEASSKLVGKYELVVANESLLRQLVNELFPDGNIKKVRFELTDNPNQKITNAWGKDKYSGVTAIKNDDVLQVELFLDFLILDKYKWKITQQNNEISYLAVLGIYQEASRENYLLFQGVDMQSVVDEKYKILITTQNDIPLSLLKL